jgi:hypothetical protein
MGIQIPCVYIVAARVVIEEDLGERSLRKKTSLLKSFITYYRILYIITDKW